MVGTPDLLPPRAVDTPRPTASYRTDLVTALLSTWFVVGLMFDAWAHNNLVELETFFTLWHAAFYSGFAATAGWVVWTIRGALRPAGPPDVRAIPVGYASTVVGLVGFAIAGAGDMVWHTVFGVEQNIDILFSPTHLALAASMLVIISTPLRTAWADRSLPAAPGLRRLLPALLSAALCATLTLLFLQYANALAFDSGSVVVALSTVAEGLTGRFVAALAVTNLVLVVTLLHLARRWVLPFGTATIVYAAAAALSAAVTGFENLELMVAVLFAGVLVDVLARALRVAPAARGRFRIFAALGPLVTWGVFVAAAYLASPPLRVPPVDDPTGAPVPVVAAVELYTGAPVVQALIGLLVAILLVPPEGSRSERAAVVDPTL